MAVTTTPITKITIDSKNFQEKDTTGAFLPKMNANVFGQADQLLGKAERVLQSTINAFEGFNMNLRTTAQANNLSDPNNPVYAGRFTQSAYINTSDRENALRSLHSAFNAKIPYESVGNQGFDIRAEEAVLVNITKNFKNRRAQMKAIEELDKVGGTLDVDSAKTKKNPYRSVISVPMSKADYDAIVNNNTQKDANKILSKYVNDTIPLANKENRIEASRQNDARKEREAKEAERKKKQEEKENAESKRKALGVRFKILAVVTTIASLVRRVANVVANLLGGSIQARKEATELHNAGLTVQEGRRYKYFDLAHGMDERTHVRAIGELRSAFGLAQNIDEDKLIKLTSVIRGDTADLARAGLPEGKAGSELLGKILNDYMKAYISGKNSLGQPEPNSAKRRSNLVLHLSSVFPQLGELLSTMLEDYESGIYKGKFTDYEGWLRTTKNNPYGLSDAQQGAFQEMGALVNSVNAKFKELSNTYLMKFALSLTKLVEKVDNIQFAETATQKNEDNKTNRQLSIEARDSMQAQKESSKKQFNQAFRKRFGYDLSEEGLTIDDIIRYKTLDAMDTSEKAQSIRRIASRIIYGDNPELLSILGSYEQYNKLYEQANKEAQKTTGKIEYNKSDYTPYYIIAGIERNIQQYSKPTESVRKVQGLTYGTYKNLLLRLRDSGARLEVSEDELTALRHGLARYLITRGDVATQIKESANVDNDFLDEIALMYNAQNPDDKIAFGTGLNASNMSKEGKEKFRELFEAGAFTEDMLLRAYINIISGKSNAITRSKSLMEDTEDAFYEGQYDLKTEQASDLALGSYAVRRMVTRGMLEDFKNKGIRIENEARVQTGSNRSTLDVFLYGVDSKTGARKEYPVGSIPFDSSVDKSINVDMANIVNK